MDEFKDKISAFNDYFCKVKDDDEECADIYDMDLASYTSFLNRRAKTEYGRMYAKFRSFIIEEVVAKYGKVKASKRIEFIDFLDEKSFVSITLWSLLDKYRWKFKKSKLQGKPAILTDYY